MILKSTLKMMELLGDLLTLTAQFGPIPIIIAGDFQATPSSYPAVSQAILLHNWYDPLSTVNVDGEVSRALTFSNDGLFSGMGEGCTSIDGFLLNQHAFFALNERFVVETVGRQHRPVECSCDWDALDVFGYTLFKTAAFDLSAVPKPQWDDAWNTPGQSDRPCAENEWDPSWECSFTTENDPDRKWQVVNRFCIHELLASGGVWGEGPHERAQPPKFIAKHVCPPQHSNHCAATRLSSALHKLQKQLDELFVVRRTRGFTSDQDRHVFRVRWHIVLSTFSLSLAVL